jgi:hypothetical protein
MKLGPDLRQQHAKMLRSRKLAVWTRNIIVSARADARGMALSIFLFSGCAGTAIISGLLTSAIQAIEA